MRYSALLPLDGPDDIRRLEQYASQIIEDPDADAELAFRARVFRLRARLQLSDVAGLDSDVEACQRAAEDLRQPLYRWQAGVLRAMRALMRGAIDEGEREAQAAFATESRPGKRRRRSTSWRRKLLTVASLRGRLLDFEAPLRSYGGVEFGVDGSDAKAAGVALVQQRPVLQAVPGQAPVRAAPFSQPSSISALCSWCARAVSAAAAATGESAVATCRSASSCPIVADRPRSPPNSPWFLCYSKPGAPVTAIGAPTRSAARCP
jgi:hypothetical protein